MPISTVTLGDRHPRLPPEVVPPDSYLLGHPLTEDELWRRYVEQLRQPGRFADLEAQQRLLAPRLPLVASRLEAATEYLLAQADGVLDDLPDEYAEGLDAPQPGRALAALDLLAPELLDDPESEDAYASPFYPEGKEVLDLFDLFLAYRARVTALRLVLGEYVATGRIPDAPDPVAAFFGLSDEMPEHELETTRDYLGAVLKVKEREARTGRRAKSCHEWCERVARARTYRNDHGSPITANGVRRYFTAKNLLPTKGFKAVFEEKRRMIEAIAERFFDSEPG